MSTQNLIIYKFSSLYQILEEIGLDLNFNIIFVDSENSLNEQVSNFTSYLHEENGKVNKLLVFNKSIKRYVNE